MAVKASATITISKYRDTDNITRYYLLQASTLTAPDKPTTLIPPKITTAVSGWDNTEPTYTSGSTNTLYFVDRYIFSDGSFQYTEVSVSSSYEAAKAAYNKAQAAQNTANTTQENLDNLEIGSRNYLKSTSNEWTDWIIPGTGTNKTIRYKVLDLVELNLKENDSIAMQLEIETADFTAGTLYAQGSTNSKWGSADEYFYNPWTRIVDYKNLSIVNKIEKFTKTYKFEQQTIDKINTYRRYNRTWF